ncbi:putative metal-binding motif-containing protein [bacterium]|nr:putative metal-binding motif-containing protein [bacterium]MBU1636512.1 putative metal-binding motif-containing protein [bacterium]
MKILWTSVILTLLAVNSFGEIPRQINYQGHLTDPSGDAITAVKDMGVTIYDSEIDRTPLWSDVFEDVEITNGYFELLLGFPTPIPDSLFALPELWLGITIDTDSEMMPLTRFSCVPYARRSGTVESISIENTLEMIQHLNSLPDADGDGYEKLSAGGTDCDDWDPNVNPAAAEICDGKDNNCNGVIDEGFLTVWYRDLDEDGYGDPSSPLISCVQPDGYVDNPGDCDDTESLAYTGAPEVCDGVDNDCNSLVDDNPVDCTVYYADIDEDGHGDENNSQCLCSPTPPYTLTTADDCDDTNPDMYPGNPEVCDGYDNDCSGGADEGENLTGCTNYYADYDEDGYGDMWNIDLRCLCQPEYPYLALTANDCMDDNPDAHPGAFEICNGLDDNCDWEVDEGELCGPPLICDGPNGCIDPSK